MRRTGRCLSYGRGITYWPLAEVIKEHFGIARGRRAGDACSSNSAGREILGLALGLDVSGGPASTRCPRPVARGLGRASSRSWLPSVRSSLLVEDLHWAEERAARPRSSACSREVHGPLLPARHRAARAPRPYGRRGAAAGATPSMLGLEPLTAARDRGDGRPGCSPPICPARRTGGARRARRRETLSSSRSSLATLDRPRPARALERRLERRGASGRASRFRTPSRACSRRGSTSYSRGEKAALQAASVIGRVFWAGAARASC